MVLSSPLHPAAQVGSCGGNYTSPSGVLYSPDFPDRYGAGRACYWTVQVAGAAALFFRFSFFDLADQTDMVELLDGGGGSSPSGQVVARFDRRSPPLMQEGEGSEVKINGDFAIVYFYSDRTNQARGFSLRYRGKHRWHVSRSWLTHKNIERESKRLKAFYLLVLFSQLSKARTQVPPQLTTMMTMRIVTSPLLQYLDRPAGTAPPPPRQAAAVASSLMAAQLSVTQCCTS